MNINVVAEMREALKEFFRGFDWVLCCGWCDYNVNIETIWAPKRPNCLYALGSRDIDYPNQFTAMASPPEVVEDRDNPDASPLEILKKIGRKLLGDGLKVLQAARPGAAIGPGPASPANGMPGGRAITARMPLRPIGCVLWDDDTVKSIVSNTQQNKVTVCGVEGQLVRARLAGQCMAELESQRQRYSAVPYAELASLSETVKVWADKPGSRLLVAEFCDHAGDVDKISPLLMNTLGAFNKVLDTAALRLLLFVPPEWSEWIAGQCDRSSALAQSLWARDRMSTTVSVQRWLDSQLLRVGVNRPDNGDADAALDALAARILKDAGSPSGRHIDWLHEALDLWFENLSIRAIDEDGNTKDLGIGDCDRCWSEVMGQYQKSRDEAAAEIQIRFQARAKPGAAPPPGSPPADFDIGPINPRKKH